MMQQITLGGAMIALPLFFQMTLEYDALQAGLSLAPLSLTMFAAALLAGKRSGNRRPAAIIRTGFLLSPGNRGHASRSFRAWTAAGTWCSRWPSRAAGWGCWCRS